MGKRVFHPHSDKKMVQSHMKDATDINRIYDKHLRTGGPLQGPGIPSNRQPRFIDMTGDTYHEMLCKIQEAQGVFSSYPGKLRRRFANNPENMLRFMQDPKNLPEAAKLGLIELDKLPDEVKEQLDLIDEADKADYAEFRRWKANRRVDKRGEDPFEEDEPSAPKADPEAQPSHKKKPSK